MPTKRCCCRPGVFCYGCCFPLEELGQPINLNFEISSPNCPELDGVTHQFLREEGTNEIGTDCGNCLCYTTDPATTLPTVAGSTWEVVGEICSPTPCARNIGFYLMCDRQTSVVDDGNAATDPCCQDIKLIVAFDNGGDVVGDRPRPQNICRDFIISDGLIIEGLVELSPIACECEDETTDFILVYDLSSLAFLCTTEFEGGPCDGQPNCCTPTACSFDGATLTVMR